MQTWAAPGRVNLIGEHTDYNAGFVLPFAISRRTSVQAALRADGRVFARSTAGSQAACFPVESQPGQVSGWAAYLAGVFWALRAVGHRLPGLDVSVDTDLPLGAGLASSAALECAVAVALNDLAELGLDRAELAQAAQRAENDYVGVPSGPLDQLACLFGRRDHALLIDTRSLQVTPVPARLAAAGLAVLVVDTRVRRGLADTSYALRRTECETAARELGVPALRDSTVEAVAGLEDRLLRKRARHVVTENARVLAAAEALRSADWARLGELMTASHASLRDDYAVSCPKLDLAVDVSLSSGALGARMTGAGFGGCAISLVPTERADFVAAAVRDAFQTAGPEVPDVFEVLPGDGAGPM
jgi:galactokinase